MNALKSTGPRTEEGKARASLNALKHGLRAASLAVPFLENPEDWEVHRSLVVRDLAPVGYLETILGERVAALLWRLGRVARYESAVVSNAIREAGGRRPFVDSPFDEVVPVVDTGAEEKTVDMVSRVRALKPASHVEGRDVGTLLDLVAEAADVNLEDENVSGQVEVPEDFTGEYWAEFDGWTRKAVEDALQSVQRLSAENSKADPWDEALKAAKGRVLLARAEQEDAAAKLDRQRHAALLPDEESLEKVNRYETTLERSLFRTLHELQRLQAGRGGMALPPPAAVDVDLAH